MAVHSILYADFEMLQISRLSWHSYIENKQIYTCKYISYEQKFRCGINIGELADAYKITKLKSHH